MKDSISITWDWQDVQDQDETLTKLECCEILAILERNHDATIGISYDTIAMTIKDYRRMNAFKNNSVFQCVREFTNQNGLRYRATYHDGDDWYFYTYHDDIFVFHCHVFLPINATCLELYNGFVSTYAELSRD